MKLLRVSLWQHALRATRLRRRGAAGTPYVVTVPAPLPVRDSGVALPPGSSSARPRADIVASRGAITAVQS